MATKKNNTFRSLLSPAVKITTPAGEKIENVKAMRINDNGRKEFYVAGKTNVYEKTQAFAEETQIENIVARVLTTGDDSILKQRKGEFMDLTELPANIFEAQQKIKEAEKTFNELPLEIRKTYNNNFNEYLKDVGSENWLKTMGLKQPEPEPEKNEPKGETTE